MQNSYVLQRLEQNCYEPIWCAEYLSPALTGLFAHAQRWDQTMGAPAPSASSLHSSLLGSLAAWHSSEDPQGPPRTTLMRAGTPARAAPVAQAFGFLRVVPDQCGTPLLGLDLRFSRATAAHCPDLLPWCLQQLLQSLKQWRHPLQGVPCVGRACPSRPAPQNAGYRLDSARL